MFGFIFGSACLVALGILVARGPLGYGHRFRRFRYGARNAVFMVLERLDATPGQEKAIRGAFDDFLEAVRPLRSELRESRQGMARALKGEALDFGALSEAYAQQDGSVSKFRTELTTLLGRVHETLDERQRGVLSELIETGPSWHAMRHGC